MSAPFSPDPGVAAWTSRPRQEPGGAIWEDRLRRHGGREFRGGAVCWDPSVACEGICRDCPRELAGEAS